MPVPPESSAARPERLPGTPPAPVTALAAVTLAAVTGTAVWALPAAAPEDAAPRARAAPHSAAAERTGLDHRLVMMSPGRRPSGYVTFVDTARRPMTDLGESVRRTGVWWYALGHIVPAADGCSPAWNGPPLTPSMAGRIARLRAAGGDASLTLGGAAGDLAASCLSRERLTAAYRRAAAAYDVSHLDFEVPRDETTGPAQRRAAAITALQRHPVRHGVPLDIGFTLPAGPSGLTAGHRRMLHATREAGATIGTVNLLVPLRRTAGSSQLRRLAASFHAARAQVASALELPPAEAARRIGLTPVLGAATDLSPMEARKLADFAERNRLAWLSLRGTPPGESVTEILSGSGV
ncbi:hypothetical protein Misp01_28600 [Microtetraspora sp. NBRC 13810]|uniref:hypothetical protein n=1 Tax=Microtetraspora sp. NBRC 13810 TaxID=3030990 RepID=UPI0024A4E091|nr:hypothetical protein [Microtetraspora sp. NBRC 13810]GLW07730.1 hypothetical protein Misp01_28600 [Microtetraspora sp. NBRC 13810]